MEATRSEDGRFARQGVRDARTLYAILRAVAEAAIADHPKADPRKVTVRQWRDARRLCEEEFGHIPLPQEIRRQLAKLDGRLLPWPELLARAFGDRGRVDRAHDRLRAEEAAPWLTNRHVWYALRYVARSLEGEIGAETTLLPRPYERERRRLVAQDARRRHPRGLAERLPTHDQIERVASTWDQALEIAQLAPRPQVDVPRQAARSMSVPEAIVRYYEVVGVLPTPAKLVRFRHDYGFSVRSYPSNVPFTTFFPEALALIAAREDLPPPRPYEETKRLRVTWPIPDDAHDPDHPTRERVFTRPELLRWVRRFAETLRAGDAATVPLWVTFARDHPRCPSTGTLTNHGGLPALMAEARRPDAIERAQAELNSQREQARRETLAADLESPRALAVIAAMRALGGAFVRQKELFANLGWPERTTMEWLDKLRAGGIIELVEAGVGRKSYRYRLTELQLSEEETERLRYESEARAASARAILTALAARGPLRSGALGQAVGLNGTTVTYWTRRLLPGGFVERVGDSPKSKKGFRITERGRELLDLTPSP